MPMLNIRSGVPQIRRQTFDETGDVVDLRGITQDIKIRSSAPIHVYFSQADADADLNYIDIPGVSNSNEWDARIAARFLWIKATNGSADVEITASMRVGN